MDPELRKAFYDAALGLDQSAMRKRCLSKSDFMDSCTNSHGAITVSVNLILYFCEEEGKYNGFQDGARLAIAFMEETLGGTLEDQTINEFGKLLKAGEFDRLESWIKSAFPEQEPCGAGLYVQLLTRIKAGYSGLTIAFDPIKSRVSVRKAVIEDWGDHQISKRFPKGSILRVTLFSIKHSHSRAIHRSYI